MSSRRIRKYLKQYAVYWKFLRTDSSGNPVYDEPLEIKVRWVDKAVLYINPKGQQVASSSIVYYDIFEDLEEPMVLDSALWLRATKYTEYDPIPRNNKGWRKIQGIVAIPDKPAKFFLRKVYL